MSADPKPISHSNTSRLFSAVSHDLRQPVQALGLWTSALRARAKDPSLTPIIDRIDSSVLSLGEMLNALTEFARIDCHMVGIDKGLVSVDDLFDRAAARWQQGADAKGLRLMVHHCGYVVHSDAAHLGRIVHHLLSNAIRFTDQGTILLCARLRGRCVRIEVRDSGRGISAEEQSLVFDDFHRVSNPGSDASTGLGLGLTIVRRLCELLGHQYALRSSPGRGSAFFVSAPRALD